MGSGLGAGSDPRTQGTRRRRARPTSTLGATAPPQHESAVRPIPLAHGRQVARAADLGSRAGGAVRLHLQSHYVFDDLASVPLACCFHYALRVVAREGAVTLGDVAASGGIVSLAIYILV